MGTSANGFLTFLFLLLICASAVSAANILCLFTTTGTSHLIIHMAIARTLVERGHNVTVVTILPLKDPNPKYHHIFVPPPEEEFASFRKMLSTAASTTGYMSAVNRLFWISVDRVRLMDRAVEHPRFQELLKNPGNHFDLVILGIVFNTYLLGVAAHFKCPVILSWINQPSRDLLGMVGSPWSLSSAPVFGSSNMMFFKNRLNNMFTAGMFLGMEFFSDYKMAQYYDYHFPGEKYPSYSDMKKNVSLVFCATHFSEGRIRPLTPGFVEIGGIQVKQQADPLPKDIDDFLRNTTQGFILFSMGTNVKSTDIPTNATLAMFKVLSQSKYKVLWKWDTIEPPGKSANIMFRNWLPQDDLLAHPDIKLFITHGGRGSTTEAQYHGVPMLAIPIYSDQPVNALEIVQMGYGVFVNYRNVTEESFQRDFNEVLENPSYANTISKFSTLYRDRPISAKQSVIYWTEYVLRHRGAKHMQSPFVHLNFFQRNSLDVLGVILLVLYLGFWLFKRILRVFFPLIAIILRRKLKTE